MNGAALVAEGLVFGYGKRGRDVLRGLGCEVRSGEIAALVGANGAGKTTLLRLMTGLLKPRSGTVRRADGGPLCGNPALGALVSSPLCWRSLRAGEWLEAFARFYPRDCAARRRELCGRLDLDPSAPVERLSTGNLQKLHVARALQHSPDLVLLDEPTSALDPASRRVFWSILGEEAERGAAILVSSHQLDELEQAVDRALLLKEGTIAREVAPRETARPWRLAVDAPEEKVAACLAGFWPRRLDAGARIPAGAPCVSDWPPEEDRTPILRALLDAGLPVRSVGPVPLSELWGREP